MPEHSSLADATLCVDVDSQQCMYTQPSMQFDVIRRKLLPALGDAPLL